MNDLAGANQCHSKWLSSSHWDQQLAGSCSFPGDGKGAKVSKPNWESDFKLFVNFISNITGAKANLMAKFKVRVGLVLTVGKNCFISKHISTQRSKELKPIMQLNINIKI